MTPHEWEDNRPPKEPRLTNLDYCVILGVSFAMSSAMMVGDLLTIGIASWAWSAYERAELNRDKEKTMWHRIIDLGNLERKYGGN